MRIFNGKCYYWIRSIGVLLLCALGVHSCNVSMYNAWQTAFPQNAHYLEEMSFRFWFYGIISMIAFGCAVALLLAIVRNINRETKEKRES